MISDRLEAGARVVKAMEEELINLWRFVDYLGVEVVNRDQETFRTWESLQRKKSFRLENEAKYERLKDLL